MKLKEKKNSIRHSYCVIFIIIIMFYDISPRTA